MEEVKKRAEREIVIGELLNMRFGDGTGTNPQIGIATKEILKEIDKAVREEGERLLVRMRVRGELCKFCGIAFKNNRGLAQHLRYEEYCRREYYKLLKNE